VWCVGIEATLWTKPSNFYIISIGYKDRRM
jgi:hypothetical protein